MLYFFGSFSNIKQIKGFGIVVFFNQLPNNFFQKQTISIFLLKNTCMEKTQKNI